MRELMGRARLIVLVSHDLDSLTRMCDRVLWLGHGRILRIGPPDEIVTAYREHMQQLPRAATQTTASAGC